MDKERIYFCIDLKSFFASVECVERGLDPMTTRLVVADPERSKGTICLAVTPAMKALGVRNRCRVYEIPENIDYITAPPRMRKYIDYSAEIYGVYIRYVSPEDIHVYSIDEVFIDATDYLSVYGMTAEEFARFLIGEVFSSVGVRAACGIGTNLYLAKIALDITAKKSKDFIGFLDEKKYCDELWGHKPLTDFWRIGQGTEKRLASYGIRTMGQIAQTNEDFLYRLFGIDAELLIDHAYGREPVTIRDIKNYRPSTKSVSCGQVLMRDYTFSECRLILREMLDLLCLDLVKRGVVTPSVTIYINYSKTVGVPAAKGTAKLPHPSSADSVIIPEVLKVYDGIMKRDLPIRRVGICCNNVFPESDNVGVQMSFFDNDIDGAEEERCRTIQKTVLGIKERYGKNAILKGMNYLPAATSRERNVQIGGHKSG